MINQVSIIVLTPVKNEAWIMDQFLRLTSMFADHILVADQLSSDSTPEIIQRYPKAVYIRNDRHEYDEEYRQHLLINKAREIPGKKLLLALDADELITSDGISSLEWETICSQEPGTRIYFKKPDVMAGGAKYIDYPDYFPLGYLDDGRPHEGVKFHSPRVPPGKTSYNATTISFLHLAQIRGREYSARQRMYAVLENISQSSSLRFRYRKYSRRVQRMRLSHLIKPVPGSWTARYNEAGIDITGFESSEVNAYNKRVLEEFRQHGVKRFWKDDIWYVDYNAINKDMGNIVTAGITRPPFFISVIRYVNISVYAFMLRLKSKLKK